MEAEYMALSDASREGIARTHLYDDLRINTQPPLILSDSQSALVLTGNPSNYARSKHKDIRYHFVCHIIQKGQIDFDYIPSSQQTADILTEALESTLHEECVHGLQLTDFCNMIIQQHFLIQKSSFTNEHAARK